MLPDDDTVSLVPCFWFIAESDNEPCSDCGWLREEHDASET